MANKPIIRFGTLGELLKNTKWEVYLRQRGRCSRCGKVYLFDFLTQHHHMPPKRKRGYKKNGRWNLHRAGYDPNELELICYDCHDRLEPRPRGVLPMRLMSLKLAVDARLGDKGIKKEMRKMDSLTRQFIADWRRLHPR